MLYIQVLFQCFYMTHEGTALLKTGSRAHDDFMGIGLTYLMENEAMGEICVENPSIQDVTWVAFNSPIYERQLKEDINPYKIAQKWVGEVYKISTCVIFSIISE